MATNVKDWARRVIHRLPEAHRGAFEVFLMGNETFAEAAMVLIESLADDSETQAKLKEIADRIEAGEDAEAVVRDVIRREGA